MHDSASPPVRPSRTAQFVTLAGLLVLVAAYTLAVVVTHSAWSDGAPRDGTRVTFAASTPDGSAASPDALAKARKIVADRLRDVVGLGSEVVVEGEDVVATAPGRNADAVREAGQSGLLYVRPVIHAIPSQSPTADASQRAGGPPAPASAQKIADEKALRQSTDQSIQVLALQFQATRCDAADALAGHDDPNLPLVTCSRDHRQVYLLSKSIISGEQITRASSGFDQRSGQSVVDVEFDGEATRTWAEFTSANAGTQVAFVLDTQVVAAPAIQEVIPNGRTQLTGGFSADAARDLANVLRHGTLPVVLTVVSSDAVTVPPTPGSTPLRIALLTGGVVVVLAVALGGWYILRRRPPSAYAAEVTRYTS